MVGLLRSNSNLRELNRYIRLTVFNQGGDFSDVRKNVVLAVIFKDKEFYDEVTECIQLGSVETILHVRDKVFKTCHSTIQAFTVKQQE